MGAGIKYYKNGLTGLSSVATVTAILPSPNWNNDPQEARDQRQFCPSFFFLCCGNAGLRISPSLGGLAVVVSGPDLSTHLLNVPASFLVMDFFKFCFILIGRSLRQVNLVVDCCIITFPAIRENRVLTDATGAGAAAKAFRASE